MFSEKLKKITNAFCDDFIQNSSLFELGRKNGLTKYHLASYLKNLEFLFAHNVEDLYFASSLHQNKPLIGDFFKHKWVEEKGHDEWARNDLLKLNVSSDICNEMRELTLFLNLTMKTSPYCYLSYLYFAEYMTIALGPIWMDLLRQNLNSKSEDVTALGNHIDLDADHYEEVGAFIDQLELSENHRLDVCEFVQLLSEKYNAFFNSLAGDFHESIRSREVLGQVSTSP